MQMGKEIHSVRLLPRQVSFLTGHNFLPEHFLLHNL